MSKAILVIDMPESCCNCPINFWNNCGRLESKSKTSGRIENPSTERLQNCPLKSLPDKYNMDNVVCDRDYNGDYEYGYNACVDEILGE